MEPYLEGSAPQAPGTRNSLGKLRLSKDHLRRLDHAELGAVQGGGPKPHTSAYHCWLSALSMCFDICLTIL